MTAARLVKRDAQTWSLEGDVAHASVPALLGEAEPLWQAGTGGIVDMAGVRRIDSSCVALMLEWVRTAKARGMDLHYRNVPRQVMAIATLSGVGVLLPLESGHVPA